MKRAMRHSQSMLARIALLSSFALLSSPTWSGVPSMPDMQIAMMDDEMGGMGGMGGGRMSGSMPSDNSMSPSGSSDAMGTDMMGRMRGSGMKKDPMKKMAPVSSLPGFPGGSHLYHVGATDFFLDHPKHITLSIEQQTSLNQIKEKALLDGANAERRIEEAEQELWTLTASEAPDAVKIEARIRAIEKLRADKRMAFIRAVGDAGKILTADQRAALLGTKPPMGRKPSSDSKMPAMNAPMPRQ
ncbi:periplasmic heavy metal sensor [Noviherbaspirillum agri]